MSTLFISHSSQDVMWCQTFVAALRAAGHTCFFDHDSIPGSAEWLDAIQDGVQHCDLCVLILSPVAWASPWVKGEWQMALRLNKPILPVEYQPTLDATTGFLGGYQWVKAGGLDGAIAAQRTVAEMTRLGYGALTQTTVRPMPPATPSVGAPIPLPARLARLGFMGYAKQGVEYMVPPLCDVPAGPFIMGSDKEHDPQAKDDEQLRYQIVTEAYQIGMYPVTVAEYACAVKANAVKVPPDGGSFTWDQQQQHPDNPVGCVSWREALVYTTWLAQMTGHAWRLPTEAEWEKAARGTDERIYPWGNRWDRMRANTNDGGPMTTTPIGAYADTGDASFYGAYDMAGNVWEWISSLYRPYPYRSDQSEKDADTASSRVLRGGSCLNDPWDARTTNRIGINPGRFGDNCGMRLARNGASGT